MRIIKADFLRAAEQQRDYPVTGLAEIAFAGRSNVGKSSMINALLGRKNLVRTSRTPGLTRKLNFFLINNDLIFVDLPGYGFARVPRAEKQKWGPMVETYLKERKELDGVIVIVDSRRLPTPTDRQLIAYLQDRHRPFIVAATKSDKLNRSQMHTQLKMIQEEVGPDVSVVMFSALNGHGKNELWKAIKNLIE